MRLTLETERVRSEDDTADLGTGEWRRHWRLGEWGVKTTVET